VRLTRRELFAGAAAALPLLGKKAAPRPSILLITVEDLGSWMLGCYGNQEIRTPNIDILARSGTRFQNSFACTPEPAPSRMTLLTGRTPRQLGPAASWPKAPMLSDALDATGYVCGWAGEWELGEAAAAERRFKFAALARGGDTANALKFLDSQKPGQPFFLVVNHTLSNEVAKKYADMYSSVRFEKIGWETPRADAVRANDALKDVVPIIRSVAAAVTEFDDEIPPLLKKLDERGLRDQTVVILTATNGQLLGRHGRWGNGAGTDPVNFWDETIGVPLIWHQLGHIPPESYRPEFASTYDLVPALCDFTGTPLPGGAPAPSSEKKIFRQPGFPGATYLHAVLNTPLPKKRPWDNQVYGESGNALMTRDKRYKLVLRDGGKGPNELYDMVGDPREHTNQFANPQYVSVREPMAKDLETWAKTF